MRKIAVFGLAAAGLVSLLLLLSAPAQAQASFSISATAEPVEVEAGKEAALSINITSKSSHSYAVVKAVLFVYLSTSGPGTPLSPEYTLSGLSPGKTAFINLTYRPTTSGAYSITVKLYNNTVDNINFLYQDEVKHVLTVRSAPVDGDGALPLAMIGVVAVVAIAAVAAAALVLSRRKKAQKTQEEVVEQAYQPPVAEERVPGKFPKDYYKFRREKFSRLKPVGLTRGGNTILGNIKKMEEEEAGKATSATTTCPKCSTTMGRDWKACKNCGAKGTIDKAHAALERLEASGGNTSKLQDMLESAKTCLEANNYDEAETYAHDVLDRARDELRKREEARRPVEPLPEEVPEPAEEEARAPAVAEGMVEQAAAEEPAAKPGAPPVAAPVAPPKPEKKEPNPCWNCSKGLLPEWRKCPYCNASQEGVCPSCGRTVKLKWNVCPQCRTDLTVQKPKPACATCGAEMPPSGECLSCKARSEGDKAARLVKEVKAKGATVDESEALLGRGELAMKLKNYDKALAHFIRAGELAETTRQEFRSKRLAEKLEHAEAVIHDSAGEGADVAEARETLNRARTVTGERSVEEAMALADRAATQAAQALAKATAGKEGAGKGKGISVSVKKPVVVGPVKVKPRCPHCQEQIEEGWPVCPFCQANLTNRCPSCGANIKPGWKMCPVCEKPLQ